MKKLKLTFWVVCVLIVTWNIVSYSVDFERRASIQDWDYYDSPDGRYTMAYGSAWGDWVWVRLRRKGEHEVIADRWFQSSEPNWASWSDDHVYYERGGSRSPIYLPPIWLEKWSAKLP